MISLSYGTVHACDIQDHMWHDPEENRKKLRLKSEICSSGFIEGTRRCAPSEWGEENGISHEELKNIDYLIGENVSKTLTPRLETFGRYHRDGIFINEPTGCVIV
jgi:hypothetical protein